jgi:hypothetical protein
MFMEVQKMLLHQLTQEVIDCVGEKKFENVTNKIFAARELINVILDNSESDDLIMELDKYSKLLDLMESKVK